MIKEKMVNAGIIFLIIFPMSFFFPWVYHNFFSLLGINSWFLEKLISVANMVACMSLILPWAMRFKSILRI